MGQDKLDAPHGIQVVSLVCAKIVKTAHKSLQAGRHGHRTLVDRDIKNFKNLGSRPWEGILRKDAPFCVCRKIFDGKGIIKSSS